MEIDLPIKSASVENFPFSPPAGIAQLIKTVMSRQKEKRRIRLFPADAPGSDDLMIKTSFILFQSSAGMIRSTPRSAHVSFGPDDKTPFILTEAKVLPTETLNNRSSLLFLSGFAAVSLQGSGLSDDSRSLSVLRVADILSKKSRVWQVFPCYTRQTSILWCNLLLRREFARHDLNCKQLKPDRSKIV